MNAIPRSPLSRRQFLEGLALSAGAVALLRAGLHTPKAEAQGEIGAGTVHRFSRGGVNFHTYVSPAEALNVTSHIVEFADQLLMVDATMLPPTAAEVAAVIAATGKPLGLALISHEHPDHWGAAATFEDIEFSTFAATRANIANEGEPWQAPANVLDGPELQTGMTSLSGVPVEIRHIKNTEALDMAVVVLPEQGVAIVQDLVYNGLYAAPGIDRAHWIKTLEELRDDTTIDTLLVGHGLPATRGDLDHMIHYVKTMDEIINAADTPDDAVAALKQTFPGQDGEFLLSLIGEYWVQ